MPQLTIKQNLSNEVDSLDQDEDISSRSLSLLDPSTLQQDRESPDKSVTSVSSSKTDDDIFHVDNGMIVNRYEHVNWQSVSNSVMNKNIFLSLKYIYHLLSVNN